MLVHCSSVQETQNASWKCPHPLLPTCSAVYGRTSHHTGPSVSVLTRLGSLRLLYISQNKYGLKREETWQRGDHHMKCDGWTDIKINNFSDMLPAVEGMLEQVCAVRRSLLWRGLSYLNSKFASLFFRPKFRYFWSDFEGCPAKAMSWKARALRQWQWRKSLLHDNSVRRRDCNLW